MESTSGRSLGPHGASCGDRCALRFLVAPRSSEATLDVAIVTQGLSKSYGSVRGLVELDLEVRPGEVFGYLGPNGAGKTTTIRLLLDYIRPTTGSAHVLGLRAHEDGRAIRRRVGYLPGELRLYDALSGRELIAYFGSLRGGLRWPRVRELADRLDCDIGREIRTLSSGNRQK